MVSVNPVSAPTDAKTIKGSVTAQRQTTTVADTEKRPVESSKGQSIAPLIESLVTQMCGIPRVSRISFNGRIVEGYTVGKPMQTSSGTKTFFAGKDGFLYISYNGIVNQLQQQFYGPYPVTVGTAKGGTELFRTADKRGNNYYVNYWDCQYLEFGLKNSQFPAGQNMLAKLYRVGPLEDLDWKINGDVFYQDTGGRTNNVNRLVIGNSGELFLMSNSFVEGVEDIRQSSSFKINGKKVEGYIAFDHDTLKGRKTVFVGKDGRTYINFNGNKKVLKGTLVQNPAWTSEHDLLNYGYKYTGSAPVGKVQLSFRGGYGADNDLKVAVIDDKSNSFGYKSQATYLGTQDHIEQAIRGNVLFERKMSTSGNRETWVKLIFGDDGNIYSIQNTTGTGMEDPLSYKVYRYDTE
ncbi:MAG: hypothetical protein WC527_07025 [Candidatus Margulisiibacteriota bacterium]